MAIFMNYDGIKGNVTEANHADWVELSSTTISIMRQVKNSVQANREQGVAQVGEISCTKEQDSSSSDIFKASLVGRDAKDCEIDYTRTGSGTGDTIHTKLILKNTIISSYSMSSSGDIVQESFTLNFTAIQYEVDATGSGNTTGDPKKPNYDLTTGKLT